MKVKCQLITNCHHVYSFIIISASIYHEKTINTVSIIAYLFSHPPASYFPNISVRIAFNRYQIFSYARVVFCIIVKSPTLQCCRSPWLSTSFTQFLCLQSKQIYIHVRVIFNYSYKTRFKKKGKCSAFLLLLPLQFVQPLQMQRDVWKVGIHHPGPSQPEDDAHVEVHLDPTK